MKNLFVFIIFMIFVFSSCQSGTNDNDMVNPSLVDNTDTLPVLNVSAENSDESQDVLFVKPNSLVFFNLSNKEFKQFIHLTGQQSEWDFDLIYKQFKRISKETKEALKNKKIHYVYTIRPKIAFLTKKGDTLYFNRKENDLFMGQIFFNGEDTLEVEEGLMKRDSLENRIVRYFNLKEDINIKQTVVLFDYKAVIKKDSVKTVLVDTLKKQ